MSTVLHIEDDPQNRLLVRKLLQAAGHEVVEAETGLDGIRLAQSARPDLILVDIAIPDLDGYEVTLRLRGIPSLSSVPIVAITAEGDRETSFAVGADGFIGKPIDASRFPRIVERFLRGHRDAGAAPAEENLRRQSQRIVERLERKVVELSEANRRLEDMAKLRREFLRNVTHELATPMTPVVGYLRLLLNEEVGPLTPLQRKCLESVETSTQRLRSLIETLLDVSSIETGRMHFYERPYDFAAVAGEALDALAQTFEERDLTVHVEPLPAELPAVGDPEKLRRAMRHVLENAAKFSPRAGEVAVGVRTLGGAQPGYELVVADAGPGLPPEEVDRVFQPFYQVDGSETRAHGGVGLGLAFARRVAEALGGGVELESPPREPVAGRRLPGTAVRLRVRARPGTGDGSAG